MRRATRRAPDLDRGARGSARPLSRRVRAPLAWPTSSEAAEVSDVPSLPLSSPAYHGLPGEIVHAIEPHSEANPAAILLQLLVVSGNIMGRGPHLCVEADEHHPNLFAVVTGETSKSRKGTSFGYSERLGKGSRPRVGQARLLTGLSSGEGLIWAVRDGDPEREAERRGRRGRRPGPRRRRHRHERVRAAVRGDARANRVALSEQLTARRHDPGAPDKRLLRLRGRVRLRPSRPPTRGQRVVRDPAGRLGRSRSSER